MKHKKQTGPETVDIIKPDLEKALFSPLGGLLGSLLPQCNSSENTMYHDYQEHSSEAMAFPFYIWVWKIVSS